MRILIEAKADPSTVDSDGETPLYKPLALALANYEQQWPIAKLLLDNGSDLNLYRMNGWSALMVAVSNGNKQIFDSLLTYEKHINYFDPNTQMSVLDLAMNKQKLYPDSKDAPYVAMVKSLKQNGATTAVELYPSGNKPTIKRSPPVNLIDPKQVGKTVNVRPHNHPSGYAKLWSTLNKAIADSDFVRLSPGVNVKIIEQKQVDRQIYFRVQVKSKNKEQGWMVLDDLVCSNFMCDESHRQRAYPFK